MVKDRFDELATWWKRKAKTMMEVQASCILYVCMYACMFVCMYVFTSIDIHIYI